jgi:MarR family transcriptional regulator, organic hydroperoxide resistance regulator
LIAIAHLEAQHGVGVNRVAGHLHLSPAFITSEVAKLVQSRLVTKRTNADDRRRVLLTITPSGRHLLDGLASLQAPTNDALFAALSAKEFLELRKMLTKLVPCGDRALALIDYSESMRSSA